MKLGRPGRRLARGLREKEKKQAIDDILNKESKIYTIPPLYRTAFCGVFTGTEFYTAFSRFNYLFKRPPL